MIFVNQLNVFLHKTWRLTFDFSKKIEPKAKPVSILQLKKKVTLTLSKVFDICYRCHNLT